MALMLLIPALVLSGSAGPKPQYVLTPLATCLNSGRRARPRIPAGFVRAVFKTHFRLRLPIKQGQNLTIKRAFSKNRINNLSQ